MNSTFSESIEKPEGETDQFVYVSQDMLTYSNDVVGIVDPIFAKDLKENFDWYLENFNEILLTVNCPSKLEKEFLKHIESMQLKKNDAVYKRILAQLELQKKTKGNDDLLQQIENPKYAQMPH